MDRIYSFLVVLACGFACLLAPAPAAAHQFAPALLELDEVAVDRVEVVWKQPTVRVMGSRLRPVLPVECEGLGEPVVKAEGTGMRATWAIRCLGGLAGKSVGVEGIASSRANVLLRIGLLDGRRQQAVLDADAPSHEIRAGAGRLGVFRDYLVLGLEHILTGWDHLLFVAGLLLLVGWGTRLLWTVTAFTIGHSVTLVLASLGLVHVPQGPVEAAIALSIYFLAVELTRRRDEGGTFTQRRPWIIAGSFGLLHGLGFAGALSEVGLPSAEIPLALLSFNVGIELGQLLFIAVLLGLAAIVVKIFRFDAPRWLQAIPVYVIGSLAVFWLLERVEALL